jgi:hypothetical protein
MEQGPFTEPESVEMAETSLNVFLACFHGFHQRFDLAPLLEACEPDVKQFYLDIQQMDDTADDVSGRWLRQLTEVGWLPRPTFCAG